MAKKSPFLVQTSQFWSGDPLLRVRIAAFIGELITLKDTPPISSRLGCRWIPALKKTQSWPISPLYSIHIQKKVLGQNKKAQTHLKSFNGRQGGILQSISGVSGASGGLKSQNFDFLTQKFKMAVFARFHFLKSKNPISGHNQARLTSGDPQNKLLLTIKFSPTQSFSGFDPKIGF